jgi:hypothetical protein
MMRDPMLYSLLIQAHQEDMLRGAGRLRLLTSLPRRNMSRRAAGRLGILVLKLGMWLKQFEQPPTTLEEHV